MALDFVEIDNRTHILFSISEREMSGIEQVIDAFNEKYNDLFDLYADFRLYENHIDYLIALTEGHSSTTMRRFHAFLSESKLQNRTLLAVGD